jgi:hypothetical protein
MSLSPTNRLGTPGGGVNDSGPPGCGRGAEVDLAAGAPYVPPVPTVHSLIDMRELFAFLLAEEATPLSARIREKEEEGLRIVVGRDGKIVSTDKRPREEGPAWTEKVFLNETLLCRGLYDLDFDGVVFPRKALDNHPPLVVGLPGDLVEAGRELPLSIADPERFLREVEVVLLHGRRRLFARIVRLSGGAGTRISLPPLVSGASTLCLRREESLFECREIVAAGPTEGSVPGRFSEEELSFPLPDPALADRSVRLFCRHCGREAVPAERYTYVRTTRDTYVPFKDMVDIAGISEESLSAFVRSLRIEPGMKRGLRHLLDTLRVASLEDEITVI